MPGRMAGLPFSDFHNHFNPPPSQRWFQSPSIHWSVAWAMEPEGSIISWMIANTSLVSGSTSDFSSVARGDPGAAEDECSGSRDNEFFHRAARPGIPVQRYDRNSVGIFPSD
jgi:hypothetical protein